MVDLLVILSVNIGPGLLYLIIAVVVILVVVGLASASSKKKTTVNKKRSHTSSDMKTTSSSDSAVQNKKIDLDNIQKQNRTGYSGDMLQGKRHGYGTMTYENKDVYKGQWENDKRHGEGVLTYANGDVLEGHWVNDDCRGEGKLTFANKDRFEGYFSSEKQYKGILYYVNGDRYEGSFKNGRRYSEGKYVYANGNYYKGIWKDDVFTGIVVLRDKDGNLCNEDSTGKIQIIKNANGDEYIGEVKDAFAHGQGTMIYANGNIYKGSFRYDCRTGYGKIVYKDGSIYEGDWDTESRTHGILKDSEGREIEADFVRDYLNGYYKYTKNGIRYFGKITDTKVEKEYIYSPDKVIKHTDDYGNEQIVYKGDTRYNSQIRHGYGISYKDGGYEVYGSWFNDECVKQDKIVYRSTVYTGDITLQNSIKGTGNIQYPNGAVYCGEIYNNHRNGEGSMTYADGSVVSGIWKDNSIIKLNPEKTEEGMFVRAFDENNAVSNYGVLTDKSGAKIFGEYRDGKFVADTYSDGSIRYVVTPAQKQPEVKKQQAKPEPKSLDSVNEYVVGALPLAKQEKVEAIKLIRAYFDTTLVYAKEVVEGKRNLEVQMDNQKFSELEKGLKDKGYGIYPKYR